MTEQRRAGGRGAGGDRGGDQSPGTNSALTGSE